MGTIYDQPVRQSLTVSTHDLEAKITSYRLVAGKTQCPFEMVVAIADICERERTNNLYQHNGDVHDEQMAGIAELLKDLVSAINNIKPLD